MQRTKIDTLITTFWEYFFIIKYFAGIGRMLNSDYAQFIAALDAYKKDKTPAMKVSTIFFFIIMCDSLSK